MLHNSHSFIFVSKSYPHSQYKRTQKKKVTVIILIIISVAIWHMSCKFETVSAVKLTFSLKKSEDAAFKTTTTTLIFSHSAEKPSATRQAVNRAPTSK